MGMQWCGGLVSFAFTGTAVVCISFEKENH